jgi:hypothetical protein
VTLAFMLFTILFTTAVSNLLSSFENNRYRFPLDGFYLLLAGMALTTAIQKFGRQRSALSHRGADTVKAR